MAGKRKSNDMPQGKNLPRKRAWRALTPPLKKRRPQKQVQQPHSQEQSYFFRLPWEIRDIIYREIFIAPVSIHLAFKSRLRKFCTFLCTLSEEDQPEKRQAGELCSGCEINHHTCRPQGNRKGGDFTVQTPATKDGQQNARVMGLLRSCKRV
jgi:hypothetical protein